MTLRKAVAIGVAAAVLGLQAWVIFPPGWPANTRYWPFVDYPMYSNSHTADAVFSEYELGVRECPGTAPFLVPADSLHMEQFVYWRLLETAAERKRGRWQPKPVHIQEARQRLSDVVRTYYPRACQLEVWERAYRLADLPRRRGPLFDTLSTWKTSVVAPTNR
jgi:hypothetical protein